MARLGNPENSGQNIISGCVSGDVYQKCFYFSLLTKTSALINVVWNHLTSNMNELERQRERAYMFLPPDWGHLSSLALRQCFLGI